MLCRCIRLFNADIYKEVTITTLQRLWNKKIQEFKWKTHLVHLADNSNQFIDGSL
jgi:hypothetical protein